MFKMSCSREDLIVCIKLNQEECINFMLNNPEDIKCLVDICYDQGAVLLLKKFENDDRCTSALIHKIMRPQEETSYGKALKKRLVRTDTGSGVILADGSTIICSGKMPNISSEPIPFGKLNIYHLPQKVALPDFDVFSSQIPTNMKQLTIINGWDYYSDIGDAVMINKELKICYLYRPHYDDTFKKYHGSSVFNENDGKIIGIVTGHTGSIMNVMAEHCHSYKIG